MDAKRRAQPIAVIGMGMRLPGGVRSSEGFWDLLLSNKDIQCEVPETRYSVDGFCDPRSNKEAVSTPSGYYLDESVRLDALDTTFFNFNQMQAQLVDPQQRLLLEVAWECMENAGQANLRGSNTGVFVGSYSEDWSRLVYQDTQNSNTYRVLGTGDFVLASSLSYHFDLRGPSITVRTACSAASTGLHMACQALYNGDCDAALVGGSSIIMSPSMGQDMSSQGILSPDGLCKTFDASADGYARAEGITCVLVKPLKDAIRDNDPIRAVIRSTAVNSDGGSSHLSVPSPSAQKALIRRAYEVAGISDLSQTAYAECHGTGTRVGDPIEASAIGETLGGRGVYIGSVKTILGHTEGGSGITGLIKSILALEHEIIPPNRNLTTPNPQIPFEKYKLQVPTEPMAWPLDKHHRISINCFGIGGSNSHVILDSAASFTVGKTDEDDDITAEDSSSKDSSSNDFVVLSDSSSTNGEDLPNMPFFLIPISAASEHSLAARVKDINSYVQSSRNSLPAIAYTLSCRRTQLLYRTFSVSSDKTLEFSSAQKASKQPLRLGFVFTGQGAQHARMGRELYQFLPSFRQDIHSMDQSLQSLKEPPKWALSDFFTNRLERTCANKAEYSQPLCTALQIALVNLLGRWGIKPDLVIGHSSGELAAAYASGRLTMAEACICGYIRGVVSLNQTRFGSMAVVGMGRAQVTPYLVPGSQIACVNSSKSVTISGDSDAVSEVLAAVESNQPDVFLRKMQVDKAYHSYHMEELSTLYEESLRTHLKEVGSEPQATSAPFYSTVTGRLHSPDSKLDAGYWAGNLSSPVLFQDATEALLRDVDSDLLLLEIGPHAALKSSLRQIFEDHFQGGHGAKPTYLSTLSRDEDALRSMLQVAGHLYTRGYTVDFAQISPATQPLTDLPNYPWDHRAVHWGESRISKAWRTRPHAHHELLGSTEVVTGTCPSIWRNKLRLEDVSWLKDHAIDSDVIFPCAGYIAMMGEAIRQTTGSASYDLRNMAMKSAMLLRSSEEIEIVTNMSPLALSERTNSSWFKLVISSFNNGSWVQNCSAEGRPGRVTETEPWSQGLTAPLARLIPDRYLYERLKRLRLDFGPRFQLLQDISADTEKHLARAIIKKAATVGHGEPDYALHPTAMDAVLQLSIVAAGRGVSRHLGQARVPARIGKLHVSPVVSEPLRAEAAIEQRGGSQNISMAGTATSIVSSDEQKVVFQLQDVEFVPLDLGDPRGSSDLARRLAMGRYEWRPHLDFCDIAKLLSTDGERSRQRKRYLEQLTALCILECLDIIDSLDLSPLASDHMTKYISWLRDQRDRMIRGEWFLAPDAAQWVHLDAASRQLVISAVRAVINSIFGPPELKTSDLYQSVTEPETLQAIILDKMHPLEVFNQEARLAAWYDISVSFMDTKPFLVASGHTQPNMRVLEIGAGTGATSEMVLSCLQSPNGTRMYSEYMFTDISAGFLVVGQERLSKWEGIEYKVLDIAKCPGTQGFAAGHYDMVIATNVIHATTSLCETLRNVHFLLRPGGRLLLQELIAPPQTTFVPFLAGFFSGWWLGEEDGRPEQPIVSVERWNQDLLAAGFEGVEAAVPDDGDPAYQVMTQITAVVSKLPSTAPVSKQISIIHDGNPGSFAHSLAASLEAGGLAIAWCDINSSDSDEYSGQDAIAVLDLERPFFQHASEQAFERIIEWIAKLKSTGVLWLTRAAQVCCTSPEYAQIIGLARSARVELSVDLWTLELQDLDAQYVSGAAAVAQKFLARARGAGRGVDCEFAIHNGVVLVGRYDWSPDCRRAASQMSPEESKSMKVGQRGLINTMHWVQESPPALKDDEVEIDVRCTGLNFKDIMLAMGLLPGDDSIGGMEAAGIVTRVGAKVHHLRPGSRVVTMFQGLFTTKKIIPAAVVFQIPDDLSFQGAATLPVVYCTAVHALLDKGKLEPGQSILIHSACGGVGQAAMQLCKMLGVEVYATVGSEEKIQYLVDEYSLDRQHIFHSRDDSFYEDIMQVTNNRGVDLVLNSLSGELLHASWRCVARWGTMIEIGKRDILEHGHLPLDMFKDNRTFCAIDLNVMSDRPGLLKGLMERTLQFYADGHIKPVGPIRPFSAMEIQDAFRYMQTGKHMGKIIIEMPQIPDALPATQAPSPPVELSASTSYLLVGGLGGLGKVIATWMVERGARNLVFLSRSAGMKPADAAFVSELESQGCSVIPVQGSVMILEDVQRAIQEAPSAVKGVVHLSAVLRDMPFDKVRHEDWTSVNGPKVTGTWNLHKALLASSLDFFILCGSLSAVFGQPGQASYAAANKFLDSFTQFRHSLGLACSTIDIGAIEGVGQVREQKMEQRFRNLAMHLMQEHELIEAVQLAIQRSKPSSQPQFDEKLPHYSSSGEISVGMASAKPLDDPANRHPLGQDIRMGFARQLDQNHGITRNVQGDTFKDFLASVESNPGVLEGHAAMEVLTNEIGRLLRSFMMMPEEDMDPGTSLESLGVDSLVSIEIRNWWKGSFGVEITVLEITNARTIQQLGGLALASLKVKYGVVQNKDSKGEDANEALEVHSTTLVAKFSAHLNVLEDKIAFARTMTTSPWPERAIVLLTGGTGYLGAEILRQLLALDEVNTVAVLVRAPSVKSGMDRIRQRAQSAGWWKPEHQDRIEVWLGDLSQPRVGLTEEHLSRIRGDSVTQSHVDAIIHNGAVVKLHASFTSLEAPNVIATVELLVLALTSKKPLRFIYVSGGLRTELDKPFGEIASKLSNHLAYSQTKNMSDRLVLAVASRLPAGQQRVSVVKPGLLLGPVSTGYVKHEDLLSHFIGLVIATQRCPSVLAVDNRWLYVGTVDRAAVAVVRQLRPQDNFVTFLTIVDGMFMSTLFDILIKELQLTTTRPSQAEWTSYVTKYIPDSMSQHVVAVLDEIRIYEDHMPSERQSPEAGDLDLHEALRSSVRYLSTLDAKALIGLANKSAQVK